MSKACLDRSSDAWDSVHNLVGEGLAMRSPLGKCLKGRTIRKVYQATEVVLDGSLLISVRNKQGREG